MKRALSRRGLRAGLIVAAAGIGTLLASSTAALAASNAASSQTSSACASNSRKAPRTDIWDGRPAL